MLPAAIIARAVLDQDRYYTTTLDDKIISLSPQNIAFQVTNFVIIHGRRSYIYFPVPDQDQDGYVHITNRIRCVFYLVVVR